MTASYPSGGFNGFFMQTAGTGGAVDATAGASDAIFVFTPNFDDATLNLGDGVQGSWVRAWRSAGSRPRSPHPWRTSVTKTFAGRRDSVVGRSRPAGRGPRGPRG